MRVLDPPTDADKCPICTSQLGLDRGRTRRRIVLSDTVGVFCWQCPDCGGVWSEHAREVSTIGRRRLDLRDD